MPRYPPELREAAVKAVLASRQGAASKTETYRRVGEQFGVNAGTLRSWVVHEDRVRAAQARAAEQPKATSGLLLSARGAAVVAGALVSAVVGAFALFQSQDFKDTVCPSMVAVPLHTLGCGVRYDPVGEEEAATFLVDYYARATASNATAAWRMLSSEYKSEYQGGKSEFAEAVQDVLWTEVVQPPQEASARNLFAVRINRYTDRDVTPYVERVRLRQDADRGVVLVSADTKREPGGERIRAWAYLSRAVDLRKFPRSSSDITLPEKDQLPRGGRLRALCRLDVPSDGAGAAEASDAGWWIRTNQGWLREAHLASDAGPPDVPTCSDLVLRY